MTKTENNNYQIETENLTKKFGDFTAVNSINLKIKNGEIFGFLGPNGAGKSTFIRMLCGILLPTKGSALISGYNIITEPEEVKSHIGYMSQKFGLYEDLTVEENIAFYGGIYLGNASKTKQQTERVMKDVGLVQRRKQLASELSGGWKQRLALACALVHNPPILFLDEPTAGVDPVSRRELWDIIYTLSSKNITIFVTTHYMEEAERCHTLGFIYASNLIALGSPEKIKSTMMDGKVITLKCSDANQTINILSDKDFIRDINIYGEDLHIVTDSDVDGISLITKILGNNNINIHKIENISASIEDVFVSLTKKYMA